MSKSSSREQESNALSRVASHATLFREMSLATKLFAFYTHHHVGREVRAIPSTATTTVAVANH